MPAIAFPLSSTPGKLPGEGEGRLINCYASKEGDTVYIRRVPGLAAFATGLPASGCRGLGEAGGGWIVGVFSTTVAKIDGAGAVTAFTGTPGGSGGVTIAHNNRSGGPDVVAVSEQGGAYTLNLTTNTVSSFADADLPSTVNSVTSIDGYLVFSCPDGRAFATDLNAVTVNALSFATAEAKPDGLVRVLASGNRLLMMGTETIEPWADVGSSPFPFARGTSVIPVGLLTTMAVAGAETGWTQNIFFVAHDRTVRELAGYDTKIVSTPDVERFLAASTVSAIEASVHEAAGRSIFTLSSDQGTWQYDVRAGTWRQRYSAGNLRWRAQRSVKANGSWFVGDTLGANLLKVDASTLTENGAALDCIFEGQIAEFPKRFTGAAMHLNFTKSAGGSAAIYWSKDNGRTYVGPFTRALDNADKYGIRINRLGLMGGHGLLVQVNVSGGTDFSFSGGSVEGVESRAP
jgi:hypothetical protein